MIEYLYSTPAWPVYTRAGRAYWPFGRTVQNIYDDSAINKVGSYSSSPVVIVNQSTLMYVSAICRRISIIYFVIPRLIVLSEPKVLNILTEKSFHNSYIILNVNNPIFIYLG